MLSNTAGLKQPDGSLVGRAATLVTTVQWLNLNHGVPVRIWLPTAIACGIALITALLVLPGRWPVATRAGHESAGIGYEGSTGQPSESEASGAEHLFVRFERELLTVKASQAHLEDLTREISRRAYIAIEPGSGLAGRRVSAEFTHLPLEAGLCAAVPGGVSCLRTTQFVPC